MKRIAFVVALTAALAGFGIRPDFEDRAAARRAGLRRQSGPAGISQSPDDKGNWTGFDVDFCRAVAAAIFNDASQGQVHAAVGEGPVRAA